MEGSYAHDDDLDQLYPSPPLASHASTAVPGRWPAARHRSSANYQCGSRDFGTQGSDTTTKSEEHVSWWKVVTLTLLGVAVLMLVVLIVLIIFHFHYRRCSVYLSDVMIAGKAITGVDAADPSSVTIPLVVNIAVFNPTKSVAVMKRLSLNTNFTDTKPTAYSYRAAAPIVHTDPIDIPADTQSIVRVPANVTFPSGRQVKKLVYSDAGCFNLTVAGEMSYSVGILSFGAQLKRSFRLFDEGACPCIS